jgi:hypothetical protein
MMATGNPEAFARKMGLRRSTLFQSLQEMRELGVNIKYSCSRQSYYYADGNRIKIKVENQENSNYESKKKNNVARQTNKQTNNYIIFFFFLLIVTF